MRHMPFYLFFFPVQTSGSPRLEQTEDEQSSWYMVDFDPAQFVPMDEDKLGVADSLDGSVSSSDEELASDSLEASGDDEEEGKFVMQPRRDDPSTSKPSKMKHSMPEVGSRRKSKLEEDAVSFMNQSETRYHRYCYINHVCSFFCCYEAG